MSQTGDWHASGRSRSPSSTMKPCQPSTALATVGSSSPWPSAVSAMIDQTHGGWIPPQEPSASCRSRIQFSAIATARRRSGVGRTGGRVLPGIAPIGVRSTSDGRTGRSDFATESETNVWRAQQEKL